MDARRAGHKYGSSRKAPMRRQRPEIGKATLTGAAMGVEAIS
jgi:hypothetical protein